MAFASNAGNFTADDREEASQETPDDVITYPVTDVFVRNRETNKTDFVSRNSGARGKGGDDSSGHPAISATGRYVAFESSARNLSLSDCIPDPFTSCSHIFVRDLRTRRTRLLSTPTGRRGDLTEDADKDSRNPSISHTGRFVAFDSEAENLSRKDRRQTSDVYVRDQTTHRTILISRIRRAAARGDSYLPFISPDGRFVGFSSDANNLSRLDDDGFFNIFRRRYR